MANDSISLLLVGSDAALLEGLSQFLSALGYTTSATESVREARDIATRRPPLIALLEAEIVTSRAEVLGIPLAPGGAVVLYNAAPDHQAAVLPATLQRVVLANISLPLERHRLVALVQYAAQRVLATGRRRDTPPEQNAP